MSASGIPQILTPSTGCIPLRIDRCVHTCVCVHVRILAHVCAYMWARFLLSLIPRSLFFVGIPGYQTAHSCRQIPTELPRRGGISILMEARRRAVARAGGAQYERRGKEFYGASDSTLAKSRLIAILYAERARIVRAADIK